MALVALTRRGGPGRRAAAAAVGRSLCVAALAWLLDPSAGLAAEDSVAVSRPRAVVAGCENQITDTAWRDVRVNFGVTALIAEALADDGTFALVEERPEVKEKLAALRGELWERGGRKARRELRSALDTAAVCVIGRLVSFEAPMARVGFAGLATAQSAVVINVEVDLVLPSGRTLTGAGQGTAARTATGALLAFREDGVFFDQTTVGAALKQAVKAATRDAVGRYRKHAGKDK